MDKLPKGPATDALCRRLEALRNDAGARQKALGKAIGNPDSFTNISGTVDKLAEGKSTQEVEQLQEKLAEEARQWRLQREQWNQLQQEIAAERAKQANAAP